MIHISYAQQANVPLNYEWTQESEARMVKARGFSLSSDFMHYETDSLLVKVVGVGSDSDDIGTLLTVSSAYPMQTSMRPWIEQGHPLRMNIVQQNFFDDRRQREFYDNHGFRYWCYHYHRHRSLLQVMREPKNDEPAFRLYIDPLLNLTYMNVKNDTSQSQFYINTRGVTAHGDIGTKISFETSFWENQAFFPEYISDFANETQVVPGQGRWKQFKKTGYDYAMAAGYLSYSPCRNFNLQVGTGKHFVGDGYRSLLLSDNAFNYPFARLTGWFGPGKMFQYTTIYASLMNLVANAPTPSGTERLFQKKAASFDQLSMKIGRVGEISLFQGLIWTAADDRNKQCIRLAYVNPVMFTSLPFYGLSDRNNYLLGGTFRFDLFKTVRLYGQWMADDLGKKGTVHHKTGFQVGVKYFNAFTLKHLHLDLEYNRVNPYSYAATDTAQAYTHYGQPLAHPVGANFSEMIFGLQYKFGDVFLQLRYEMANVGADSAASNYGQNIFKTDYFAYYPATPDPYKIGQGMKTNISYLDINLGYMISYASNLNISAGYTVRNVEFNATSSPTSYVYLAVRTSLTNNYFDFFRN
ncbi:MAG TPA: capsule assembly Wzi family protein [Bacteroidia bacterium]|nr:capsule assembly Wzi family protein [Bacteroidia bacterium]